jgi:FtsP/CotA-like multicopper oxidase with cupredoxin domain
MPLSRRAVLAGAFCGAVAAGSARAQDGFVELRARKLRASLPGIFSRPAELWTFDGKVPGPVLRARQGTEFKLRLINELDEPLALHCHGVRLGNAMDGTWLVGPPVAPGSSFDFVFTPPDAGTFWYRTTTDASRQRERGLSGMFIVEEADPLAGILDVPLLIDDWATDASGAFDEASFGNPLIAAGEGRLGRVVTVNGETRSVLSLPSSAGFLRLRLLNAANARFTNIRLNGGDAHVVAHDGQPVEPVPLRSEPVELVPGQRLDLLLPSSTMPISIAAVLDGRSIEIVRMIKIGTPRNERLSMRRLQPNPLPSYFNYAALREASFTIEGGRGGALREAKFQGRLQPAAALAAQGFFWAVNGSAGPSEQPLLSVPTGSTVAITVDNITRFPHALHLHGHAARLIERAGRQVAGSPWRDTFIIRPLEPAKILFIADNPGRWLFASTVAEHFDSGLQAWFRVA